MPRLVFLGLVPLLAVGCASRESEAPGAASSSPARTGAGDSSSTTAHGIAHGIVHEIAPGPRAQQELIGALIGALHGETIQLEAGRFELDEGLIASSDHLTIRGRGREKTTLSFRGQKLGKHGIEATGDAFLIEDLAVEDTVGDAIKVLGARGVTFRRVRAEWTRGPSPENGAYGLYPVQCSDVLIDDCVAIGASDAGIYVGQSERIVVRNSRAERNVAGIEIENSIHADVHDNLAQNNTGGILVFDLPGLDVANGRSVRVFRNRVLANNHENFAPPGNIVANVSPGTGVMVLAAADVEVFENEIRDHDTLNVSVYSYLLTGNPVDDADYVPYAERVHVHDNRISGGGGNPRGRSIEFLKPVLGVPFPQIFYDGVTGADGVHGITLARNGDADLANLNLPRLERGEPSVDRAIERYTGQLPALPTVTLEEPPALDASAVGAVARLRRAPKTLSEHGLFRGALRAHEPADGVVLYELNSELFSDYTTKRRFVRVPAGTSASYRASGVLEFPVGTVISKTFSMPHDLRDPAAGGRLIETRILEREPGGWYGVAYLWNEDESEAHLSLGGGRVDLRWTHTDGSERESEYIVPNAAQCRSCHVTDIDAGEFLPIGPKARNLHRELAYAGGSANQLAHWTERGLLGGAPDLTSVPRVARAHDASSGSVDARARAWLDINCAHCHSATGPARTSGLDLRIEEMELARLGIWKTPVAAGRGSGGRRFGIVPGRPDDSILVHRIESSDPGVMMPTLPRRLVDEEGVALVREWITAMPPYPPGTRPALEGGGR